jgi:glycosyltransferase involved in cell wall biosynthesis
VFDVFVLSSIHEGFSNAIVEAMAAGKPVVAPDSGGNPEAVEHGKTGYLYTPCDSRSLADALHKILTDEGSMKTMGDAGKEKIGKQFSRETMIQKNEEFFMQCLQRL